MVVAKDVDGEDIFLSSIVIYNNKYYTVEYKEEDLSFVLKDMEGAIIYNNFNNKCKKTKYKTLSECIALKPTEVELHYKEMFEKFTSSIDNLIIKELNNASSF